MGYARAFHAPHTAADTPESLLLCLGRLGDRSDPWGDPTCLTTVEATHSPRSCLGRLGIGAPVWGVGMVDGPFLPPSSGGCARDPSVLPGPFVYPARSGCLNGRFTVLRIWQFFGCVLRVTWCHCVCFSCCFRQNGGTINVSKLEVLTSRLIPHIRCCSVESSAKPPTFTHRFAQHSHKWKIVNFVQIRTKFARISHELAPILSCHCSLLHTLDFEQFVL